MTSESVWLGVPLAEGSADVQDPYVSKVGGKAMYLRAPAADSKQRSCPAVFACPKCKSAGRVSLLAQLYAPLECYDRVLYVLTCAACGTLPGPKTEGTALATAPPIPPSAANTTATATFSTNSKVAPTRTSFCFAVRCQNFNMGYYKQLAAERERSGAAAAAAAAKAKAAAGKGDGALFEETDDWGVDGASDWGSELADEPDTAEEQAAAIVLEAEEATPLPALVEVFAVAANGSAVPVGGRAYTSGLPLDLYVEPPRKEERLGSTEDQLAEAQRRYGADAGTLDTTSAEQDDETPMEKVVRKYVERIGTAPSQCVRWCPDGAPLRSALMPSLQSIPGCPACRAPRRFECQLTAPLVYYLIKGVGESKNTDLHFANVLVYTCSKNCYSSTAAYTSEYVVVEDEI